MSRQENITPKEIEQSFLGSYILSPQDTTGHNLIFALMDIYYGYQTSDVLMTAYGKHDPDAPELHMPNWHKVMPDYRGTNISMWNNMLRSLTPNPTKVREQPQSYVRSIISNSSQKDVQFFDQRKKRLQQKIAIVKNPSEVSLVKSLFIEEKYPYKTQFYDWLLPQINAQIHFASNNIHIPEPWIVNLRNLSMVWKASFPKHPFFNNKK